MDTREQLRWAGGEGPCSPHHGVIAAPQGTPLNGPGGDLRATGFEPRHVNSVSIAADGGRTVTVLGGCLATSAELRACLALGESRRWRALAMLPGRFWTIVRSRSEVVVFGDLFGEARVFFRLSVDDRR